MMGPVDLAKRQLTLLTHRIHTLPVVVLMPESRCNCRCVMCDIWKSNATPQELAPDLVSWQVESFRRLGVRWVVLSGGEALLHPELWGLVDHLRALPIRITLLSTGLLLARNAPEIARRCDEVIVSLDGSREVHDAIRGVLRAYDRLAEGVAALRASSPAFRVTGRCVVQRRNYLDLPNVIATARAIGLDQISFLAADVSTTAFNRPQPWDGGRSDGVALDSAEVAELERVVEETIVQYAAEFATGFVAESPDKLRRLPRYFAALAGEGEFPTTVCNAPWVSTVVEPDGTVRPCFFQPPFGNVNERPLESILNSAEAIAFRRRLDVRSDPICRKCVCTLSLGPRTAVGRSKSP